MSNKKSNFPEKDPYEVLGIQSGASDAEIAKAYRKLALQLHPDKQQGLTTDLEKRQAEDKFQEIQQARSFLLDAEHEKDRRNYEVKRASEQMRRQADAARERKMSEKRKHMRDELKRQEEAAMGSTQQQHQQHKRRRQHDSQQQRVVNELRKQGAELREAYADREYQQAVRNAAQEKKLLEERQIRLKWSRKKFKGKPSPSEHSIASMLSRFGAIESVEMLGSKGNAALVTFASSASCEPCVKAYADSDEMRAKYIGDRLEREETKEQEMAQEKVKSASEGRHGREQESVEDWKLRRAAERENLLREMEQEGEDGDEKKEAPKVERRKRTTPFPPPFPDTIEYKGLKPFEKLEKAEASILEGLLPAETIRQMRLVS